MSETQLFTCLSCSIAFLTPEDQRVHYKSDHHRYNMKRRVAGLPPISAEVFNQKVLERKQETAIMSSTRGSACDVCNKFYTTENAYRSHIQSKKHKDNELKAALRPPTTITPGISHVDAQPEGVASSLPRPGGSTPPTTSVDEEDQAIDEKIAAARARLSNTQCLFCNHTSSCLEDNLTHMSNTHSFFIPDAEYLVDITGLIIYLGEKIAVGNVCIFCNQKGREFRTMDAVRKHMVDKGHCKIAYDTQKDRLEVSNFYDFTASYPDASTQETKTSRVLDSEESDGDWEDADDVDDDSVDEVVEESGSEAESTASEESDLPENELSFGDTNYELVLPSGARIGHRSLKRYYDQTFPGAPRGKKPEDPNSGAALVRRLIADKNSALVPRKGGFGAYGAGTDVVKARNRGEAREAGRHVKEFRDQRRREEFKTRIGFNNNHQKHYRDPLLQ